MDNFEGEKKSKKLGGLLVVVLLIVIAIVAGAGYYYLKTNNAKYVFTNQIDKIFSSDSEMTIFKTAKVTTNISAKVNSDDEELKEVADLVNDAKLTVVSEMDVEKKEEVIGVKLVKAKDDLLDAKLKVEEESKKAYIDLGELFGKTLQVDIKDVLGEDFDLEDTSISSVGKMINGLKAQQIVKEEINSQLKDEYFSMQKANVDGKNLTKNELKISGKELKNVIETVCNDLANNEEFLACFEDKDDIKKSLKDMVDALKEMDADDDVKIAIDIYTSGFKKNVERVDFTVDDGSEKVTVQLTKKADDQYAYKVIADNETQLEGQIKVKVDKSSFEFEISVKYEESEFVLNLNGNVVYDEELDNIKTKGAVDINDLSMDDYYEIMGNLSESKLYQIIEEVSGSSSYDSEFDLEEDDDDEYEEEDDEIEDEDEEE